LIRQERQRPPTEAGDLRRPIAFGNLVVTVDDRLDTSEEAVLTVMKYERRPGLIRADRKRVVVVMGPIFETRRRARRLSGTGVVSNKEIVVDPKKGACVFVEHLDEIAATNDAAARWRSTPAARNPLPGGRALRLET
jgi:hypothetical protein